jgi:hypothetical protein
MSRGSSRSDGLAPSLFPFLAVLLCTMGALVLILMLSVAGAHTATTQILNDLEEQYLLEEAKIELVKSGLREKLEENRITLEKKRLALQAIERHIDELIDELDRLKKQIELADNANEDGDPPGELLEKQITELEKQLAEATEQLEQKLEDPSGEKPIFAIIPYQGTNGTHRRPIYLECNARGVVIQPEGVVLSPNDLKPPYGPGNPLDAALRTIRSEFPSTTGSVTNNPYPLLVVRPSGIRHYMMARAAMSGWDDQFGYELISEDLELAYPSGPADLKNKIVQALERARQRQAALIAAMPKHYDNDFFGFDSGAESSMFASGPGGGRAGEQISSSDDNFLDGSGQTGGFEPRSGDSFVGGLFSGGNGLRDPGGAHRGTDNANSFGPPDGFNAHSMARKGTETEFGSGLVNANGMSTFEGVDGRGSDSFSQFGGGSAAGENSTGGSFGSGNSAQSGSSQGSFVSGADSGAGKGTSGSSLSSNSAGMNASSSGQPHSGSHESQMTSTGATGASGFAAAGSTGSMQIPVNMVGSPGSPSPSVQTGASNSSGTCDQDCGPGAASANMTLDSNDPVSPSVSANWSRSAAEVARPLAQSRGANWAWERPQRTQTAVVRSIQMRCQLDRWIILPEKGSKASPVVIELQGSPEQRAERLAEAVRNRVDSWGVALAGGHWSPVLQVEVAPDADWRFEQLLRLMDGSGIAVVRKQSQ